MIEQENDSLQKLSRGGEDLESSRNSRHSGQLGKALNHSSNVAHSEIVKQSQYRSSFAVLERLSTWFYNCFRCANTEHSYVHTLDEVERKFTPTVQEDLKKIIVDKIIKLKIIETSRLLLDPNVMHPFVKVHFINKNTGCYLQIEEKTEDPIVYHYEELTSYNKIEKKYESHENDIVLPFATELCDFRKLGNSKGIWNQKFYINYPAHYILHPDTLILFELLDFNHQALIYRNEADSYDKNNFYRIAWGFLRPIGTAKNYLGKFPLELYRYKYQNSESYVTKSSIPDVYYDFLWSNHQKYGGFLTIQLNYSVKPRYRFVAEEEAVAGNLFQEEQFDRKYLDQFSLEDGPEIAHDQKQSQKQLLKFYRNRQICEVPQKLIYKLQSEQRGCYRVKFIGNNLVAACSNKKNTVLKVYNLQKGELIMTLKGHHGIIYKIESTPNLKYMITSGSDNLVKIWNLPENPGEYIDEDESQAFIMGECVHAAAVYSLSVVHQPLQDTIFIITCCYDGYIRLWEFNIADKICLIIKEVLINDFTRSASKVYPTACMISENSLVLVGDSIGQLRIFQFSGNKLSLRSLVSPDELKGDAILSMQMLNKNHLMIQAKDNLIRHYELIGNKIRMHQSYTGAIFQNQLANCAVSPDNKYLLSPSQNGKPYIWDIFTATLINLDHLNLNIKGRLVCCDWHPKYNLVVFGGFVQFCPIFVYGNVLNQSQIKLVSAQIQ